MGGWVGVIQGAESTCQLDELFTLVFSAMTCLSEHATLTLVCHECGVCVCVRACVRACACVRVRACVLACA